MRADHTARPVDEQGAQVALTALGNAQQALLAPGGVLSRGYAQPGREASARVEDLRIADGGHRGAGGEQPHAGHLRQAPARLVLAMPGADACLQLGDLLVQAKQLQPHGLERLA